jgi:hypothetical protein
MVTIWGEPMNRFLLPCLVFVCLAVPALAQQSNQASQTVLNCDESAGCTHQFVNGAKFKTLTGNGFTVTVALSGNKKYFRADVSVLNSSASNADVFPANFTLEEVEPKDKSLAYVDAEKIMRSIQKRAAWGNAMTGMGSGMQRQQSTTTTTNTGTASATGSDGSYATGTYNGSSVSTTSSPDYAAQARANQIIQARNQQVAAISQQLSQTALRTNTVAPNQSVRGFVFFEADKKVKDVVLSIPVGATVYRFPFGFVHQ